MLLAAICVAALAMTLLANTLRILLAIHLQTDDSILHTLGINGSEIHRLIGLSVYLPLLTLQMMPGKRVGRRQMLSVPILLYAALMVLVPLLTGNAMRNPALFLEHLLQLVIGIAVIQAILHLLMKPQQRNAA
jgi:hypothetical protein